MLDKIVSRAIDQVWQGKLQKGDLDADLWRHTVTQIWNGLDDGIGRNLETIAYHDPIYPLAQSLRHNAMILAAFKGHHNINDMVDAMRTSKSFAEFKDKALALNSAYNQTWLKAEYQTAVGAAQMAEKWHGFQQNRKYLPYLTYQTVGDDRVRLSHRLLDGITRHIDDAFWDEWFPPNGWLCRCSVLQVAGGETPLPTNYPTEKQTPPAFRFNPGKTGQITGPEHPYFKNLLEKDRNNILRNLSDIWLDDAVSYWKNTSIHKNIKPLVTDKIRQQLPILSESELSAFYHYTQEGFFDLNHLLRIHKEKGHAEHLKNIMDMALRKMKSEKGTFFRGTQLPMEQIDQLQNAFLLHAENTTFTDPAFLSISKSKQISDFFTFSMQPKDKHVKVQFVIQTNHAKNIEPISYFGSNFAQDSEHELLLNRNTHFRVKSIDQHENGVFKIHLENL